MNITMYWPNSHGPAKESYERVKEFAGRLGFIGQHGTGNIPRMNLALAAGEYVVLSAEEYKKLQASAPPPAVEEINTMTPDEFSDMLTQLRKGKPQRDGRYLYQQNPPSDLDGLWSLKVTGQPRMLVNYSTGQSYIEYVGEA